MMATETTAAKRAARGGKARAASLTPEERSYAARRAVLARWAKAHAPTVTTTVSRPQPAVTRTQVTVATFQASPQVITKGVETSSSNSRSFVTSPKNLGGSSAR